METAFYIVGTALVLIALAVSFIGMRSDGFPSSKGLRIGLVFVAVVVFATTVLAVRASKHEASERDENAKAAANEEQQTLTNEDAGGATTETGGGNEGAGGGSAGSGGGKQGGGGKPSSGDATAGKQVFADQGCGGCHTLKAAGSTGQIGPDLDTALVGKDEDFIRTSIVDPSADIAKGYQDGIMPTDFGDKIPADQLNDLIAFLQQSTGSG